MIEIRNLSLVVSGKNILHDISAELPEGKVTAILGPNGAGKSSLLKCLTGSQKGYEGFVGFEGRDLRQYGLKELAAKRAVLSQHLQVAFPFTAEDIVLMGRNPYFSATSQLPDEQVVRNALSLVDAEHLRQRLFPTLSGGEQQRVQLARILAQLWETEGACLFLDEPTSALDLKHQFQVLSLIHSICERQSMTIVVILHDLNLARKFTHHSLLLKDGRLISAGDSREILTSDRVEETYQVSMKEVTDQETGDVHLFFKEEKVANLTGF